MRTRSGRGATRREEGGLRARPEERKQERFGGLGPLEPEGDPSPQTAQPSPELVARDGDPLPVEHHHQTMWRARGMEPLIDPGLQAPEDLVDLLPPAGQQAL